MGLSCCREGLSTPRRRLRYIVPLTRPLAAARQPNDVLDGGLQGLVPHRRWDALRPADGRRACSRFVLCCRIVAPTGAGVRPWFERTFRTYGSPRAMRTDNGAPFASTGPGRLSRLAVWWLKLGIHLDRIDPGHPEQNGRHERFHLTLQTEADLAARARRRRSSKRALIACGRSSTRCDRMKRWRRRRRSAPIRCPPALPGRPRGPWYDATCQVRRVSPNGQIKWKGDLVFVSEAVVGELVGLAETERGDWTVRVHARRVGADRSADP